MTKHISHLAAQSVSIHKTTLWACAFLALFEAISLHPFHSPSKLDSLVTIHTYFKLSFEQSSLWMTSICLYFDYESQSFGVVADRATDGGGTWLLGRRRQVLCVHIALQMSDKMSTLKID